MNKKVKMRSQIAFFLVLVFLFISTFGFIKLSAYSTVSLPLVANEEVYHIIPNYNASQSGTTTLRVQTTLPMYVLNNSWVPSSSTHSPSVLGYVTVNNLNYYLLHYFSNGYDFILLSTSSTSLLNTIYLYGNDTSVIYSSPLIYYRSGNLSALSGISYYCPMWNMYSTLINGDITFNFESYELEDIITSDWNMFYVVFDNIKYNTWSLNGNIISASYVSNNITLYSTEIDLSYYVDNSINYSFYYYGLLPSTSQTDTYFIGKIIIQEPTKESTLADLVDSVVNVPIIYLRNILSFSIFNFTALSIVYTVLFVLLLIGVVKLFIGGKH